MYLATGAFLWTVTFQPSVDFTLDEVNQCTGPQRSRLMSQNLKGNQWDRTRTSKVHKIKWGPFMHGRQRREERENITSVEPRGPSAAGIDLGSGEWSTLGPALRATGAFPLSVHWFRHKHVLISSLRDPTQSSMRSLTLEIRFSFEMKKWAMNN